MPCYNVEQYIDASLTSILEQTYQNLDILLIDDGSSDRTYDILKSYEKKDKRIRVFLNEKNLGLIRTLNFGIKNSLGDYIARMDADDISELNRIEVLYAEIKKDHELDAISASAVYINTNGTVKGKVLAKGFNYGSLKFISFFSTPVIHPCILIKKTVLEENQYNTDFIHSEDYELFSRLIFLGHKFKNLPEILYRLRINPESVSRRFENIQIATHTRISERNLEKYYSGVPEYYLHKVIINRISFKVSVPLIKKAFEYLVDYRNRYVKNEKLSEIEILEIDKFLVEQRIDILLQSIKYTPIPFKISIILYAFRNLKYFLRSIGREYIANKLNI